jgi:hypothetical protein
MSSLPERELKEVFLFSLFHRAFQFTIYNGPTNGLVCNKTLIQMSHTKTLKITQTYFDRQMIIIGESTCLSTQYNMQNE